MTVLALGGFPSHRINTARVQIVFVNALDMPTPNHVSLRADCVDNSYAPDRTER
ncbi:MAG: hypothetical protein RLZZ169_1831 [Pseudomonadota bacterium]|jgi:hypothetical protein